MLDINEIFSKLRNKKYNRLFLLAHDCYHYYKKIVFFIMSILFCHKIKKNKILASSYYGDKYDDNTRYLVEELHNERPDLEIVWLKSPFIDYDLPKWITVKNYDSLSIYSRFYEYITSKVWLDTHHIDDAITKKTNQLFIETWHGGLGIKKIELDIPNIDRIQKRRIRNTSSNADFFISNSKHLTDIYRRAFAYKGKILEIGYPKNDCFFKNYEVYRKKVRDYYKLDINTKLILYAPTFRDQQRKKFDFNLDVYSIDSPKLCSCLQKLKGGNWFVLKRMHPFWSNKNCVVNRNFEIDATTSYLSMQELIMASDLFISDYSSCIFDAALANLPCFIFATDFYEYKTERDTYYNLEELPFPIAQNNEELINNIINYQQNLYNKKWADFKKLTQLKEKGIACKSIVKYIIDYISQK